MTTAENSVADLDQLSWAVGLADVLQLIPVPASRTQEINPKVVNGGLAVCELDVSGASLALSHPDPLSNFGQMVTTNIFKRRAGCHDRLLELSSPDTTDDFCFCYAQRVLSGIFSILKCFYRHCKSLAQHQCARTPFSIVILRHLNDDLFSENLDQLDMLRLVHAISPFNTRRLA